MIEVLVRNRFRGIPGATARRVADNVWEIRVPRTPEIARIARRGLEVEDWDGAVFAVDGVELEPAVGSSATRTHLAVAALAL